MNQSTKDFFKYFTPMLPVLLFVLMFVGVFVHISLTDLAKKDFCQEAGYDGYENYLNFDTCYKDNGTFIDYTRVSMTCKGFFPECKSFRSPFFKNSIEEDTTITNSH